MEDALRDKELGIRNIVCDVLILVVMEDALRVRIIPADGEISLSLNPCCNGRCSASKQTKVKHTKNTRS